MKFTKTQLAKILLDAPKRRAAVKAVARHMVETSRSKEMPALERELGQQAMSRGVLNLNVRSARKLGQSELDSIKKKMAGKGIKHVEVKNYIDPSLLGGVVIETPEGEMDLSISSKLTRLKTRV